jgi:DNA-binding IclR family transcriptional regulator
LHSEIGKTFPQHCTGIGKVLLAHLDKSEFDSVLKGKLKPHTNRTITSKTVLQEELKEIRSRGYALDDEEITRGLICIAAPIFGPQGKIAGALSCTFPTWVRDDRGVEKEINAVRRAAAAASPSSLC